MAEFLASLEHIRKLLVDKKSAVITIIAWLLIRIAVYNSEHFVKLAAFYNEYMHFFDIAAAFAFSCLLVQCVEYTWITLKQFFAQRNFKRAKIKKLQSILEITTSEEYHMLISIADGSNRTLNVADPIVQSFQSLELIVRVSDILTDKRGISKADFTITDFTRQHVKVEFKRIQTVKKYPVCKTAASRDWQQSVGYLTANSKFSPYTV